MKREDVWMPPPEAVNASIASNGAHKKANGRVHTPERRADGMDDATQPQKPYKERGFRSPGMSPIRTVKSDSSEHDMDLLALNMRSSEPKHSLRRRWYNISGSNSEQTPNSAKLTTESNNTTSAGTPLSAQTTMTEGKHERAGSGCTPDATMNGNGRTDEDQRVLPRRSQKADGRRSRRRRRGAGEHLKRGKSEENIHRKRHRRRKKDTNCLQGQLEDDKCGGGSSTITDGHTTSSDESRSDRKNESPNFGPSPPSHLSKHELLTPLRQNDMVPGGLQGRSSKERRIAMIAKQRVNKLLSKKAGNSDAVSSHTRSVVSHGSRKNENENRTGVAKEDSTKTVDAEEGNDANVDNNIRRNSSNEKSFDIKRPSSFQVMGSYVKGAMEAFSSFRSEESKTGDKAIRETNNDETINDYLDFERLANTKHIRKKAVACQHFDHFDEMDYTPHVTESQQDSSYDNILTDLLEERNQHDDFIELKELSHRKLEQMRHDSCDAEEEDDDDSSSSTSIMDGDQSAVISLRLDTPHQQKTSKKSEDTSNSGTVYHPLQYGIQCVINSRGRSELILNETLPTFSSDDESDNEGENHNNDDISLDSSQAPSIISASTASTGAFHSARYNGDRRVSNFGSGFSSHRSKKTTAPTMKRSLFLRYGISASSERTAHERTSQSNLAGLGHRLGRHYSLFSNSSKPSDEVDAGKEALNKLLEGADDEDIVS